MSNLLIAEIKKRMLDLGWQAKDLAKDTGYSVSTIYRFMAKDSAREKSLNVKNAICTALNISE